MEVDSGLLQGITSISPPPTGTHMRQFSANRAVTRTAAIALSIAVALRAPCAAAQSPSFLFTVSPRSANGESVRFAHADFGYGERVFDGVGVDRFEQRVGLQVALGERLTLLTSGGVATAGDEGHSAFTARAEVLTHVLPRDRRQVLALGVGVAREYEGASVALARVVAGYVGTRWEAMSNLRLERAVSKDREGDRRDGIDVITTIGAARRVTDALHVGIEAVGEDLEGLFDAQEAEGGAKLMVGPTLRLGPTGARWNVLVGGGCVLRLSGNATNTPITGATRAVPLRGGYVIRSSVSYRW
jgi:hypothetical protein